ncbi:MAG TPA: type II secretion system F family protein [Candidatus Binataceae bacterium]|nr:type II secretion system F family protein [Candidatus Binataceae bacterium]
MTTFFVSLFVFCMLGVAGYAAYLGLYGSHRALEDRFADLAVKIRASGGVFDDEDELDSNFGRVVFRWAATKVPAPDLETPAGEKLQQSLVQAGYTGSGVAHTFMVIRVLCLVGAGVAGALVAVMLGKPSGMVMLYAIIAGVLGFVLPSVYISRSARRRQGEISRQLSDTLDLLVVCVEAGLGLFEAIKIVGTESERQKQAIGRELSLVSSEISTGASLGQALRNLADRTAVEDIRPLAATLIQSEQLGAQIAPALHASSDALRTRRRLRAEEAAQKTTIKILFPLVLFILPSMLMVIMGPAIIQIINTLGK